MWVVEGATFPAQDGSTLLVIATSMHDGQVSGEGINVFRARVGEVVEVTQSVWPDLTRLDFLGNGISLGETIDQWRPERSLFIKLPGNGDTIDVWYVGGEPPSAGADVHACYDQAKTLWPTPEDEDQLERALDDCDAVGSKTASIFPTHLEIRFDGTRFIKSEAEVAPYPWASTFSAEVLYRNNR